MEAWIAMLALVALSILAITAFALQSIATICKHGGVTIRVIREEQNVRVVTAPETVMSKEDQDAIDKYNEEQSQFLSSIRNLQKIFVGDDQMTGEDK